MNNLKGNFVEALTVRDVKSHLSDLEKRAVIFLDVDDTLITPTSKVFRAHSPHRTLIDELKKERDQIPYFERILSRWRLQRQVQLVSEDWLWFIKDFKTQFPIYALTKMESGPLGDILSMEEWRYAELSSKGMEFTLTYGAKEKEILLSSPSMTYEGTFYKGIFSTGSFNKSEIVRLYLQKENPSQVVLVDDRLEQLQDVSEECSRRSIPFIGVHFKGHELIPGIPDPSLAEFQKNYLLNNHEWLEDEKAERSRAALERCLAP
ncbi:MAG: DUF2608 domain-containing protein [Alphaproteobacteria bacterium]|nr:DUF2608 domain-containing protein [Alphaproteobacteria bacterium]